MPHYYDSEQDTPSRPFRIKVKARGVDLELWSDSGIFSKDELDRGTELLLKKAEVMSGSKVLDLGCGLGVVACVIKTVEPSCEVVASDVSLRAVQTTMKNADALKLAIDVRQSDGFAAIPERFDTILFNPPYVAGRETIFRLLDEAAAHLKEGGTLQVVARHKKGGAMIMQHMQAIFGNCDDSKKGGGFRVYVSKKA
jgi:16S rRNA (guanine1207-N2)-methyltransferase